MGRIKLIDVLILFFSFFLGFGKFDPFGTNGIFFDFLTLMTVFYIGLNTDVLKKISNYKVQLLILLGIVFYLFMAGLFYGIAFFNLKLIAAIILFWFLSDYFNKNPRNAVFSLLLFSISSGLIALSYQLGIFESYAEIRNGRLLIFEENPNSISTRMAFAFIILVYIIFENPINTSKWRFLLSLIFPSLFFFIIETASRGSFLILLLGTSIIIFFSQKIHSIIKIGIGALLFISASWLIALVGDTTLFLRFVESDSLLGVRSELWTKAIQIFSDNPYGVGEKGYLNEMNRRFSMFNDTHNLFVQLLVTGGVITLSLFFAFLITLAKRVYFEYKDKNVLHLVLFASVIFMASKTGGVITYLVMWYLFAFINGFGTLTNNRHTYEIYYYPSLDSPKDVQ